MLETMIYFVIYIVVVGCIAALLNYLVDAIPLQDPFRRIAKLAILVISILIVIVLLLQLVGIGGPLPRLRA